MGHDVFVSHSSEDKVYADAVVAHFEKSGIRCWVAPRDILPGSNWAGSILTAIENSKLMVLIFSSHANSSNHICREVERAVHHGIPVAPLRIADVKPSNDLEYFLSSSHWMDAMTQPMEQHFARLAEKVKLLLKLPGAGPGIAGASVGRAAAKSRPIASAPAASSPTASSRVVPASPVTLPTPTPTRPKRRWLSLAAAAVVVALVAAAFVVRYHYPSLWGSILQSVSPTHPSVPLPAPAALPMPEPVNSHSSADKTIAWTNSLGMKFAYIPAGSFLMGSPADEVGRSDDETQHKVTLTRGFLMGITHVTRGQFASFVQESGYQTNAEKEGFASVSDEKGFTTVKGASWRDPGFEQQDDHPAVEISWSDATMFCNWLSKKEGKRYRLPTEAEWEYAARAGTQLAFPWGNNADDGQGWANCADQTVKQKFPKLPAFKWTDGYVFTSPAGAFKPNAFGLYDMIGNALEWCSDWAANYPDGDATDPHGAENGRIHVLRGGSWRYSPRYCRCANRGYIAPTAQNNLIGFRIVLESVATAVSAGEKNNGRIKASKIGDTWTNTLGMSLTYVPAGTFLMGSPPVEAGRVNRELQHKVTLTKSFLIGTTDVTQDQYLKLIGQNPSQFHAPPDHGSRPVEMVSWDEAVVFCAKLSEKEHRHYRLPTEAEWEYACRAGTTTDYNTGDEISDLGAAGWYMSNAGNETHPAGQKRPNAWGLYDMLGNVSQWCSDWHANYPNGETTDPHGVETGSGRTLRGGSWFDGPRLCRCAARHFQAPGLRNAHVGFRVVLDAD
jgi:formylglycine-generating enzyme required for sulfatase activity